MNYDPNVISKGTKQEVKLTFAMWEFRAERTETIGGNCGGLDVIDCAVENVFESLEEGDCFPVFKLTNPAGETLQVEDEDNRGPEFLKRMLIKAEIVSLVPAPFLD